MNKKEVSELKKHFDESDDLLTVNKVLTTFVSAEKEVLYNETHNFITMLQEDKDVYMETLKNVLSTAVGKKLTEFKFEQDAYEEQEGIQAILYNLIKSEFSDYGYMESYSNKIASTIEYPGPYTVITAYCTYSIPHKDSTDEFDMENNERFFKFLVTAICPVDTSSDGFMFNSVDKEVVKKVNDELIISMKPTDGFIFPAFSNRMADVNSVMIYTKSIKDVNISISTDFLNCTYKIDAETEKNVFDSFLSNISSDDLNYNVINHVNEAIKDKIAQNTNDTDIPTIDVHDMEYILRQTGMEENKLERIKPVWESICGVPELTASNLITHKHTINSEGVSINVSKDSVDKIHTSVVDGRKCIVIDIDEPMIEINGMSVKL